MRRLGHPDPVITTTLTEELPRLATGKLKRFVPLAPETAGSAASLL
jgi:hypothetical protein